MANLAIQKTTPATLPATVSRPHWPEKIWNEFLNWDPFREMMPYVPDDRGAFMPAFEVKENRTGYTFKADVPGVAEKDLEITLTGNRLTIAGSREAEKQEQGESFYCYERSFGSFSRSFTLPDGIDSDHVSAGIKDGVLTVAVAKLPEVQPKKIAVEPSKAKA